MSSEAAALAESIRGGDRRALAKGITLVESTRVDHRAEANSLVDAVLADTGGAYRLGISGAPGAGKSTFIEALGSHLIDEGHTVAVLAVDPTSSRTGGSVLGDKTRMEHLSRRSEAFIRPSPSGGTLGGVARRTREAMLLCEAAGFDVVLVETVGVGQSEVAVAGMVDMFCLLLAPAAGDELQGVKRGIVELADMVVVNKADGDLLAAATRTATDYRHALHLLRPRSAAWSPPVLACSSIEGTGVQEVWEAVVDHRSAMTDSGDLAGRRAEQAREWLWSELTESLHDMLRRDRKVAEMVDQLEGEVGAGRMAPSVAAGKILAVFSASPAGGATGSRASG